MDTLNKLEVRLISIAAMQQAMTIARVDGPTELANRTRDLFAGKRKGPRPISRQIVSHLLNGTRSTVSANTARAIEEALGVTAGSLFAVRVFPGSLDAHQPRVVA